MATTPRITGVGAGLLEASSINGVVNGIGNNTSISEGVSKSTVGSMPAVDGPVGGEGLLPPANVSSASNMTSTSGGGPEVPSAAVASVAAAAANLTPVAVGGGNTDS